MQSKRFFALTISILLGSCSLLAQQFIANTGQWSEPFEYKLEFSHAAVFMKSHAMRFHLRDAKAWAHYHDENSGHRLPEVVQHHAFEIKFNGAAENISPQKKRDVYHNYYLGKNPENWRGGVPLYEELLYSNVYHNIDMLMRSGSGHLKYDLILKPGSNPEVLRWVYEGVFNLRLVEGKLHIQTSVGEVVEDAPVAWQIINGANVPVDVSFKIDTGHTLVFVLGEYNPNHTLIIDPNFIFSSYTGSTADNFGYTATYDAQGNTYGGGISFGLGYPVTLGAFQTTPGGGSTDVAISKFNATGTSLIFSTYLGGSNNEQPHSMVVDSTGNLIIIGITGSANFPVVPTGYDTTFNPGQALTVNFMPFGQGTDIFISKFNAAGTLMLGGTFLGGSGIDGANQQIVINYGDQGRGEVIVNQSGDIFFISSTTSNNFPMAGNTMQNTISGGQDAVVGKFNANLSQLMWSTYLGGSLADAGYGLQLSPGQTVLYATGGTRSTNFPIVGNVYQTNHAGDVDGFITSLMASTGAAVASTYNGTTAYDQNFFVTVDDEGDVYVFGQTKGAYPVSSNVFSVQNGTQFLHQLTADLQQSKKSMRFGSGSTSVNISPSALMVDKCKHIYTSGWGGNVNYEGNTQGMPITPDAFDSTTNGSDFYFMVLDGSWQYIRYATFFGGNGAEHVDGGTSRFSPNGIIHQVVCAGCGGTSSFPAFPGNVVSTTNNSQNCNMACLRIDFEQQQAELDIQLLPDSGCIPFQVTWIDNSKNVDLYQWDFGDGVIVTGKNPVKIYTLPGTYHIVVSGWDTLCNTSDMIDLYVTVEEPTVNAAFMVQFDTCEVPVTVNFINQSIDAAAYWWNFGNGNTSNQANPTNTYFLSGNYTVTMAAKDSNCNYWDTATYQLTITTTGGMVDFSYTYDYCIDDELVNFTTVSQGYHQFDWDFGDGTISNVRSPEHRFTQTGWYTVQLRAIDTICNKVNLISKQLFIQIIGVVPDNIFPNVFTPNGDGVNDEWLIHPDLSTGMFADFKLEVYNRWGNRVYVTYNAGFRWYGNYNENPLPEGVYFWVLWYKDVCDNENEKHGSVHLMK